VTVDGESFISQNNCQAADLTVKLCRSHLFLGVEDIGKLTLYKVQTPSVIRLTLHMPTVCTLCVLREQLCTTTIKFLVQE
jgi:hypothetical protein